MSGMAKTKSKLPAGVVRDRLDRIMDECGYSSLDELGKHMHPRESRATVSSWQTRNSYGLDGALKLHALTGASLEWLYGASDVAFPNGPKMAPTLTPATVYADILGVRASIIALARALQTTPGAGAIARAWSDRVRQGPGSPWTATLLFALETLASSEDDDPSVQSVRPHAKHDKRTPKP